MYKQIGSLIFCMLMCVGCQRTSILASSQPTSSAAMQATDPTAGVRPTAPAPSRVEATRPAIATALPAIASASYSGKLVRIDAGSFVLQLDGTPRRIDIPFNEKTQICRQGCTEHWSDLKPGDRIDTFTDTAGAQGVVAQWVVANQITGYGRIATIHDATLAGVQTFNDGSQLPREWHILNDTKIRLFNGGTEIGQISHLNIGDEIYFTATADDPDVKTSQLWVMSIDVLK